MPNAPNVLLICTDHWPGALLGCENHPVIQTPTIDQLARNGTRFTQAYSECPVCIPARRTLMTGTSARVHGDRVFQSFLPMPEVPTLADAFRDAGYQAFASGKLHVFPQRNRIGFDDVILAEEGRAQHGVVDDYEIHLADMGYAGMQFGHGMSNNQYVSRAWHLPEGLHNTTWTTDQMERLIRRRDPTRPAFWYLSYAHPHPPLTPPSYYLDLYRGLEMDKPPVGDWATDFSELPYRLRSSWELGSGYSEAIRADARRAFYALCTHIDHQIRRVIGTLREEDLLDNTYIMFTSDHGDMLGTHNLWAKRCFYEPAARVPMILCGPPGNRSVKPNSVDTRLIGLQDVMPTLLSLSEIDVPRSVEGCDMVGGQPREFLYGEHGEAEEATRMIHDGRHKLVYYAAGNRFQLFDLETDPLELKDLASEPAHSNVLQDLTSRLVTQLYGDDEQFVVDGTLKGLPEPAYAFHPDPGLYGQRGTHWPPPPATGAEV